LTLVRSEHQEENNVAGRKARKETGRLCSDNEAGGKEWKRREIKLKELKHEEGHTALRK
jgi:hypothetical protein